MARVLFADSTTWDACSIRPNAMAATVIPPRVLPAFGEWNGRMPDAVRIVDPRGIETGRRKIMKEPFLRGAASLMLVLVVLETTQVGESRQREPQRQGATPARIRDEFIRQGSIGVEPPVRLTRLSRQIREPCGLLPAVVRHRRTPFPKNKRRTDPDWSPSAVAACTPTAWRLRRSARAETHGIPLPVQAGFAWGRMLHLPIGSRPRWRLS